MKRVVCLLLVSVVAAIPLAAADKAVKPIIAIYDLAGLISEAGRTDTSLLDNPLAAAPPLTLLDISRSMEMAVADPAVKAVVITADEAELDLAQAQEIRNQLLRLREAGKDVWMYSEHLTNRTALIGSAANHFALMPEAACEFHGIQAESMYFKNLLEKVGVRAEVIQIGEFKSFGETFNRTGPSDEAQRQQDQLIDSVFGQLVAQVAAGRKLTPEKVRALIDDGTLNAKQMVAAGIADELSYRTGLVQKLRATYGKDANFDRGYDMPDPAGPEIKGIFDLFKLMFKSGAAAHAREDFVAVVAMDGDISDESVAPVRS